MEENHNIEKIVSEKTKKWIIFLCFAPIIFVLGLFILHSKEPINVLNQIFSYKIDELKIVPKQLPTLSETIYYIICSYTVIVSGIFSYLLYKVSQKSTNLTEENIKLTQEDKALTQESIRLQQASEVREIEREKEKTKESAFGIYLDLKIFFEDAQKFIMEYCRIISEDNKVSDEVRNKHLKSSITFDHIYKPNRDWMRDLRNIRVILEKQNVSLENICRLYSEITRTIRAIEKNKMVREIIINMPLQAFEDEFIELFRNIDSTVSKISNSYFREKGEILNSVNIMGKLGGMKSLMKNKTELQVKEEWKNTLEILNKISQYGEIQNPNE